MMTAAVATVLAAAGSNIAPWLIGAGIVIVLGALALIIGQVVRSRRAAAQDAAAALASAASPSGQAVPPVVPGEAAGDAGTGHAGTDPISPDEPR